MTAIEGPLGWARAMGDEPAITEVVGGLGEQWELLQNTYKPYPCGIVFHSVIDACVELRNQYALTDADIAAITVSGNQLLLDRGMAGTTQTREEAEHNFLAGKQPSGRFVQADGVASLILFLCSDGARDMTGAALPIDGGWSAS